MLYIEVNIYIDVLIIVNLIFNFIVLILTTLLINIPVRMWKLIIVAVIEVLFQILIMIVGNKNLGIYSDLGIIYVLIGICIEVITIIFMYGRMNIKKTIVYIGWHMAVLFLMGGFVTAVYDKYVAYTRKEISVIELILLGIMVAVFVKYTFPIILKNIYYRERIYDLNIRLGEKEVRVKALYDTGNSLTEPTTHKNVIIVEKNVMAKFKNVHIDKMYIIPYKSIGSEDGVLYGIEVEEIEIIYEKYRKKDKCAIVAIYNGQISKDGRYRAILNKDMLI